MKTLQLMWLVLGLSTFTQNFAAAAAYFQVPPSFGDIVISQEKEVIVSLAPDGSEIQNMMAYICADFHDYGSMSRVVSRQQGYSYDSCSVTQTPIDYSNTGIQRALQCNCSGSESHIMRCCNVSQVYESLRTTQPCDSILVLRGPCREDGSLYRLGDQESRGNQAYQGQVLLFPPNVDSNNFGVYTPSMGLVAVKKEGEDCQDWRFVYKDSYTAVDHTIATTFCRQMGYTDVVSGSIMTRRDYESIYTNMGNFSYWAPEITDPFLHLSNITCRNAEACLACCNYPHKEDCRDPGSTQLSVDDLLVIRCTFYLEKKVLPSGDIKSCQFTNGRHAELCKSSTTMGTTDLIAAIVAPASFFILVSVVLAVVCILLCLKCQCQNRCKRNNNNGPNGYQPIQGENSANA